MRVFPQSLRSFPQWVTLIVLCSFSLNSLQHLQAAEGCYVRFKLIDPADVTFHTRLGGYIHKVPWYLPRTIWPENANRDRSAGFTSGRFTDWFDVKQWGGTKLHRRMNRSGGIAEYPNMTIEFIFDAPQKKQKATPASTTKQTEKPVRRVIIELATAPNEANIVKRFDEKFTGNRATFLVSPNLKEDHTDLESLSQMQARHLAWAKAASGGKRVSPKKHYLFTSFYGPTMEGAEVLWLLGLNVVGHQTPEMREKYPEMRNPGHTHSVMFGPAATKEQIDELMQKHAKRNQHLTKGDPFGFSDEICARPLIGENLQARAHFHEWLAKRSISAQTLGVNSLTEVIPIETPDVLKERMKENPAAARRVFYYTCRFRQEAGTERIRWHTEAMHRHFPKGLLSYSLVADHPYFGGTGLGMGLKTSNTTWGNYPLALDWFDLARNHAVDLIAIEDWMGLQYMYGPNTTWEGFQLMGYQAAMMRSGSRGKLPIMSLITPSDETNLTLKTTSALAQGSKHYFYWTYGPTAFGTENYWSDLKGEYDGIARIARQLAKAEHITGEGEMRKTKVALLYSVSSDLWQPFGYKQMLERRALYLALVHHHYLVDFLTEEDLAAGRLQEYDVLYATDANISSKATSRIEEWVKQGGYLFGTCAAGSRNEFDESVSGLSKVFGIDAKVETEEQKGEYRVRGRLNGMRYLDQISLEETKETGRVSTFGVLGVKVKFRPSGGKVIGTFGDGTPAAIMNEYGKGKAVYLGGCLGLSYLKDAKFVPDRLAEKYPALHRDILDRWAMASGAPRLVELSEKIVEAGLYDSPKGSALVLANFTYRPIEKLSVSLPVRKSIHQVRSVEAGSIPFQQEKATPTQQQAGFPFVIRFQMKLGLNDIVLLEE